MQLAILFLFAVSAFGAVINTNGTGGGNCASTATYAGGVLPTSSDSVNVVNGDTINITTNCNFGTSPNDQTTIVLSLNASGKINCNTSGATLHIRGNVSFTGGSGVRTRLFLISPGCTVDMDSSLVVASPKPKYKIGPVAGTVYSERAIEIAGVAGNPGNLTANASGNYALFSLNGGTFGNQLISNYGYIRGFESFEQWFGGSGTEGAKWDVQNTVFDTCGEQINPGTPMQASQIFRHDNNVHINSLSDAHFKIYANGSPSGGGIREIKNNVFDLPLGDNGALMAGGFTVENNFLSGFSFTGDPLVSLKNNITIGNLVLSNTAPITKDLFVYNRGSIDNPHTMFGKNDISQTFDGIIFQQYGPVTTDTGEFVTIQGSAAPTPYYFKNSIFLPNAMGSMTSNVTSFVAGTANARWNIDHNTLVGGWGTGNFQGLVQISEANTTPTGALASFRSNLMWREGSNNYVKIHDLLNASGNNDVCNACDYNAGEAYTQPVPTISPYPTNSVKGYVANFTVIPGAHDVDEAASFYDKTRVFETFDNKYYRPFHSLGAAPDWNNALAYSVGDMVKNAIAGQYWGEPVTFRYTNSGSCGGTNPQPGPVASYTTWSQCWELATEYRIREAIKNKETFTDVSIGVFGDDVIKVIFNWIRQGYSPMNYNFENTAHDGTDIGAMPVIYPPYTVTTPPVPGTYRSVKIGGTP